ncbi:MAG: hypothetical protein KatS3mg012_1952 [Gaiellaceae bacterium]|nr:MAG: hypothetical protein KatS3mg012_1952 [Gaiellaceae bacterium]
MSWATPGPFLQHDGRYGPTFASTESPRSRSTFINSTALRVFDVLAAWLMVAGVKGTLLPLASTRAVPPAPLRTTTPF